MPDIYGNDNLQTAYFLKSLFKNNAKVQEATDDQIERLSPKKATTHQQDLRGSYFKGLKGLDKKQRQHWEKQYLSELEGMTDEQKDDFFRTRLFEDVFANSDNEEDKKIWENRRGMTRGQRDALFAQKAIAEDLDGQSDAKQTPFHVAQALTDPSGSYLSNTFAAKQAPSLRDNASEYLSLKSSSLISKYYDTINRLDSNEVNSLIGSLDDLSSQISPYFNEYTGTDKLSLSQEDKKALLAKYNAWEETGGPEFAVRMLQKYYQDTVANNQSFWEKALNTGAQFVDSAAGNIIRAAGMMAGMTGIGVEDDQSYWEHILDNNITRYGDRIATTQSWKPEEQQRLEEVGMQDNPILGTVSQQEKMLSGNTPFEVIGQYGFTLGSTLLSFGGSGLVNGAINLTGTLARTANGGKALNSTTKGIQIAKNLIKAKDIGNILVAGGIGTVEGAMNAVQSRNDYQKENLAKIDDKYNKLIDDDIEQSVLDDYEGAIALLNQNGIQADNKSNPSAVISALQSLPNVREQFALKYQQDINDEKTFVTDAAKGVLFRDFVGNSIINGFVNTTLQSTLNAPTIQRTLQKYGIAKSPLERVGVNIEKSAQQGWKAIAKEYTKGAAIKDRFKEAWGEGIEEYTQDLSGAYAQGYGADKLSQYLDYKYKDSGVTDSFEHDVVSSIFAGLQQMGDTAISQQAIKDGMYGALSTIVGGVNANMNFRTGEGKFNKYSPVEWRSALSPLFSNKEVNRVNKQREQTAQNINEFFSDKEIQDLFFNIEAQSNWMMEMRDAAQSGDEKRLRDAKVGKLVSAVNTLNSLRGTAYYDAVMASLNARQNFNADNLNDANSAESQSVDQYLQSIPNKTSRMSREQALDEVVDNTQQLLDMIESVNKESREVEKMYGATVDSDLKEAIVFQRIAANDAESRIEKLDEELNIIKSNLEKKHSATPASGLAPNAQKLIARFGTIDRANKYIENNTKKKESLQEQLLEIKSNLKLLLATKKTPKRDASESELNAKITNLEYTIKQIDTSISNAQQAIEALTDETAISEGKRQRVLSASEIINLDAQTRAFMLDRKNRTLYSDRQLTEIDKVRQAGNRVYTDFEAKIADRDRLERSLNGANRLQLLLMEDPTAYNAYLGKLKSDKRVKLLEKQYSYLGQYDAEKSYEEFSQEMSRILRLPNQEETKAALNVLNRSNSAYWDRYKQDKQNLATIMEGVSKLQEFTSTLDKNDQALFGYALTYLNDVGADINNSSEVINRLTAQSDDGELLFREYINSINENLPDNQQVTFTSLSEIIDTFNTLIKRYNQVQAQNEKNAAPIPTVENPVGQSKVESEVNPTINGVQKEEPLPPQSQEPINNSTDPEVSGSTQEALSALAIANQLLEARPNVSNAIKDRVRARLNELSMNSFSSAEEVAGAILELANSINIRSAEDRDIITEVSVLKYLAQNIKPSLRRAGNPTENIFANVAPPRRTLLPTQLAMATLDIEAIYRNSAANKRFSALVDYYYKWHIGEYLAKGNLKKGDTVYYISDPDLVASVKESMGEKYSKYDVPLIIVKQDDNGPLIIGDVHYQPVGIMPSTYERESNPENRKFGARGEELGKNGIYPRDGNAHLGSIREQIDYNNLGQFIKGKDGKPLRSLVSSVSADPIKGATQMNDIVSLTIDNLGGQERTELDSLSPKERRNNPSYKRVRRTFLSRLQPTKNASQGLWVYPMLTLGGTVEAQPVFIMRKSVSRSTHINTGQSLVESLNGDATVALAFNSRIRRASNLLRTFFEQNLPTEDSIEIYPDGTISDEAVASLDKIAKELTKKFRDFIYIKGAEFNISYDENAGFQVSLVDSASGEVFHNTAFSVTKEALTDESLRDIMKQLLLDGSTIKLYNGNEPYWQINTSEISALDTNPQALSNLEDIFDDNILEAKENKLDTFVHGVYVLDPLSKSNLRALPDSTVVNPSNATPASSEPIGQTNTPAGSADINTGQGSPKIDTRGQANLEGEFNPVGAYESWVFNRINKNDGVAFTNLMSERGLKFNDFKTQEQFNKFAEEVEASIAKNISIPQPEAVVAKPKTAPIIDEHLGVEFDQDALDDMYSPSSTEGSSTYGEYVNPMYRWGEFTDFTLETGETLNAEETVKALTAKGFTKQQWDNMSDAERQHELECSGVAK